jgi:hypothetical protein
VPEFSFIIFVTSSTLPLAFIMVESFVYMQLYNFILALRFIKTIYWVFQLHIKNSVLNFSFLFCDVILVTLWVKTMSY